MLGLTDAREVLLARDIILATASALKKKNTIGHLLER
jgi:hypothetical protein